MARLPACREAYLLPDPGVSRFAGSATRARSALPGRQQPIPAKVDQRNELSAIRSNPHSYRDPAASDGEQPILTRSPVGRFMPSLYDEIAKHVLPETSTRDKVEATAHAKRLNRA